jgi:hypothetical protein
LVVVIALTTFFAPPFLKFALTDRPARTSLGAWFFKPLHRRLRRGADPNGGAGGS